MVDSVQRLHEAVIATREGRRPSPRTERLFAKGRQVIAKKLAEEGVEVALDAILGNRAAVIRESADLLYNLVVVWVDAGIDPKDVWAEMSRREQMMGIAEKLPKAKPGKLSAPYDEPSISASGKAGPSKKGAVAKPAKRATRTNIQLSAGASAGGRPVQLVTEGVAGDFADAARTDVPHGGKGGNSARPQPRRQSV